MHAPRQPHRPFADVDGRHPGADRTVQIRQRALLFDRGDRVRPRRHRTARRALLCAHHLHDRRARPSRLHRRLRRDRHGQCGHQSVARRHHACLRAVRDPLFRPLHRRHGLAQRRLYLGQHLRRHRVRDDHPQSDDAGRTARPQLWLLLYPALPRVHRTGVRRSDRSAALSAGDGR